MSSSLGTNSLAERSFSSLLISAGSAGCSLWSEPGTVKRRTRSGTFLVMRRASSAQMASAMAALLSANQSSSLRATLLPLSFLSVRYAPRMYSSGSTSSPMMAITVTCQAFHQFSNSLGSAERREGGRGSGAEGRGLMNILAQKRSRVERVETDERANTPLSTH